MLVSQQLTSDNYQTWSRAMAMALSGKNKLGFVNGSMVKPDTSNSMHMQCGLDAITWSYLGY